MHTSPGSPRVPQHLGVEAIAEYLKVLPQEAPQSSAVSQKRTGVAFCAFPWKSRYNLTSRPLFLQLPALRKHDQCRLLGPTLVLQDDAPERGLGICIFQTPPSAIWMHIDT